MKHRFLQQVSVPIAKIAKRHFEGTGVKQVKKSHALMSAYES